MAKYQFKLVVNGSQVHHKTFKMSSRYLHDKSQLNLNYSCKSFKCFDYNYCAETSKLMQPNNVDFLCEPKSIDGRTDLYSLKCFNIKIDTREPLFTILFRLVV